jgi:mitogen-activated protein kinase kinase
LLVLLKLTLPDFGVSKELLTRKKADSFTGTIGYLAPERVSEGSNHSTESDVWSFGLSIIELAIGRFPFPPVGQAPLSSVLDLLRWIEEEPAPSLEGEGNFTPEFISFTQKWYGFNLIFGSSLIKDPDMRPNAEVLLQDPFVLAVEAEDGDLREWAQMVLGLKEAAGSN